MVRPAEWIAFWAEARSRDRPSTRTPRRAASSPDRRDSPAASRFTNWPRERFAALLPPELTLAPNGTAPDVHPVMFVFGDQADGALIFGGLTVPTQITYQELGIVVPFVQYGAARICTTGSQRMYSSYFPAVWHGNAH
jgi:hypothetical protein